MYYPNGQLESEVTYVGEEICGVTRIWHENGVLKEETPVKASRPHGVLRQWDSDGNLLDENEFVNGTGIDTVWYDNGQQKSELATYEGAPHGRGRSWDEEGELIVEQFYIVGRRVSKKKYLEACAKDKSLPQYDPNDKAVAWGDKYRDPPIESHIVSLKGFEGARNALEWLQESSEESLRTLGELASAEASIELVHEYLGAGAKRVLAVSIETDDDGSQNTGYMLVELPAKRAMRKAVLAMCNEQNQATGFSPVKDSGQKFIHVALD